MEYLALCDTGIWSRSSVCFACILFSFLPNIRHQTRQFSIQCVSPVSFAPYLSIFANKIYTSIGPSFAFSKNLPYTHLPAYILQFMDRLVFFLSAILHAIEMLDYSPTGASAT